MKHRAVQPREQWLLFYTHAEQSLIIHHTVMTRTDRELPERTQVSSYKRVEAMWRFSSASYFFTRYKVLSLIHPLVAYMQSTRFITLLTQTVWSLSGGSSARMVFFKWNFFPWARRDTFQKSRHLKKKVHNNVKGVLYLLSTRKMM